MFSYWVRRKYLGEEAEGDEEEVEEEGDEVHLQQLLHI